MSYIPTFDSANIRGSIPPAQFVEEPPLEPQMKYHGGILGKLFPFLRWSHRINRQTSRDDLLAGFTGALIVLPQGVAFATIAGLPPQYGL